MADVCSVLHRELFKQRVATFFDVLVTLLEFLQLVLLLRVRLPFPLSVFLQLIFSFSLANWVFAVSKTEPFLFARTVVFLELRFLPLRHLHGQLLKFLEALFFFYRGGLLRALFLFPLATCRCHDAQLEPMLHVSLPFQDRFLLTLGSCSSLLATLEKQC